MNIQRLKRRRRDSRKSGARGSFQGIIGSTNRKFLALSALVAAVLAIVTNLQQLKEVVRPICINLGMCQIGSYFLNARIDVVSPLDGRLDAVLADEEGRYAFSDFRLSKMVTEEFSGSVVSQPFGPIASNSLGALPLQMPGGVGAYWAPAEGLEQPLLGFPILDLLVSKSGEPVEITDIIFKIHKSTADNKPYVQVLTHTTNLEGILLINESAHRAIKYKMRLNSSEVAFQCEKYLFELESRGLPVNSYLREGTLRASDKVETLEVADILESTLGEKILFMRYRQNVFDHYYNNAYEHQTTGRNFDFENDEYAWVNFWKQNNTFFELLPDPPLGFWDWIKYKTWIPEDKSIPIFGTITTQAGQFSFETAFCVNVPIFSERGYGSGAMDFLESTAIQLEERNQPYEIAYPVQYRLDEDKHFFRSAIVFHADRSAVYDLTISLRSFENTVFESNPFRLEIFAPQGTLLAMGCSAPYISPSKNCDEVEESAAQ